MKNYTQDELKIILDKHSKWLMNDNEGERANLSYADLRYANLSSANLRSADLRSANLRYANLSSANLRSADLLVFHFKRHVGYFTHDGNIIIGCHNKPIAEWLDTYKVLAAQEGYTKLESVVYGKFIKLCDKMQKHHDKKKVSLK